MVTITVHTAEYAPWEEGADERERISESSEDWTFDNARECAAWLENEGFGSPSDGRPYRSCTWLAELDPYEHPHTGVLIERSAHAETTVDARLWAAIVHTVSRVFSGYSGYTGPYYVERRNDFGVRV
jgi:hypothetical protein